MLSLNHGVNIIEKGYKKTVCPDGKYFHQNKLFFIFTLIIFSEHSYFLRKSQITPKRKQRKKYFLNSIWSFRLPAKPLFMGFSAIFQSTQTLGRRDLSGCFPVHICAFYSSYSSYFAFLCTSSKIFRAKMEPS